MLKKDNWWIGLIMGSLIPGILYIILHYINIYIANKYNLGRLYLQDSTVMLIAIIFNVFILRYFLLKKKFDKAGRGVMLITFIFAGVFFYFKYQ